LLLDGGAMLGRPDLRASEETFRRWCNAVALTAADGTVVIGADASLAPVQALIRWDAAGLAARELADRRALDFPPATRFASLTGTPADIARVLAAAQLPASAHELGSTPAPASRLDRGDRTDPSDAEVVRTLLRVSRSDGAALAEALHAAAATGSAKRIGRPVRIVLDPLDSL
jgi:primosomal protein N' (replication factor Y)